LILRGHPVELLARRTGFEGACGLFLDDSGATGALPDAALQQRIRGRLGVARVRAHAALSSLGGALAPDDAMEALRAALAHGRPGREGTEAPLHGLDAAGSIAVLLAAWARGKAGQPVVAPDPEAGHAHDLLRMVRGAAPTEAEARALDAYLVTVIDHGMNASTFAARVVASTGADLDSALTAGLCALKGPLHGGAPGPVLDMLDAVGSADQADAWVSRELDAGRRIMGMGHRIYRVRDPRALVLERATVDLAEARVSTERLALARAVEQAATAALAVRQPNRRLAANVEFYTAVLLDAVGLPRTLFTPLFAASRVIGWTAHVFEQKKSGRLIRPASRYVGPTVEG
jgi:citrate synthase